MGDKIQSSRSNAARIPKLDTIIEGVVKKDSLDDDKELSRLQNFMHDLVLDTASPLEATFKELGKDEPDPDSVSTMIQQATLS